MRRRWEIARPGSIERVRLIEEPLPPLAPDRVRIAVKAVGLNFADIFALLGLYSATPKPPFTPGFEVAGTVVQSCASGPAVGSEVIGLTRFGAYVTHVDVAPAYVLPLPAGWTAQQGAAYPVQTLTAWYALVTLGAVRPGQKVLIHSAAGGVGLQAMQICQRLGAHPVGTVSRAGKVDVLRELGFTDVLVRSGQTPWWSVHRDYDLVLDAVGGDVLRRSYDALAPAGRLVTFGAAEFTPRGAGANLLSTAWRYLRRPRIDPLAMVTANKSVMGFNLVWLWDRLELLKPALKELAAIDLPPPLVGRTFPFERATDALAHLKSGASVGKVVLTV